MLNESITSALGEIVSDGLGIGLIALDQECRIIFWNDWMEKHSSIKSSDISGKSIFECFPSLKEQKQDRYILSCLEKQVPALLSPHFHKALIPLEIAKGGQVVPMKQVVKIYPVAGVKPGPGVIIVLYDVTEQMLHEAEISRLTSILKGIRNINQLIARVDSEDELLIGACQILVEEIDYAFSWICLIEEGTYDLKPAAFAGIETEVMDELVVRWDDSEYGRGAAGRAIKTGLTQVVQRIGGEPLSHPWQSFAEKTGYRSVCSLPLKAGERVVGVLNVHSQQEDVFYGEELELLEEVTDDIAFAIGALRERKRRQKAEGRLKASLKEKETLLREIHHRVKNNMQVISSLLQLQASKSNDRQVIGILEDSRNRIQSMALIHDKLYRSEDFTQIDFTKYIQELSHSLFRAYGVDPGKVTFKSDIEQIPIGLDCAIPCGLLVNELVTNSLKHAFPKSGGGEIRIALHAVKGDETMLSVSDNGIGLPKDLDFRKTASVGLHLVTILAENQLEGKIELDRTGGTKFSITFKPS